MSAAPLSNTQHTLATIQRLLDYLEPPGYAARVRQLEEEGLTTSDAQGVADAEFRL